MAEKLEVIIMLIPLSMTLMIASVAIYLCVKTTEEIVKVAAAITALICLFVSLFFVPWPIKLLILILPFFIEKLQRVASR
ncbi:MAG: hypothetical protein F6K50_22685 [Moorea sp. SIO3I7]|nr:hypothetical protein [Moorena sp. SIO3I7]NEO04292.1 hypothetical protein [Moorena sp. SIO3I8]NEP22014.1 hypothetical protein [Moorena sp. SIO3I6]